MDMKYVPVRNFFPKIIVAIMLLAYITIIKADIVSLTSVDFKELANNQQQLILSMTDNVRQPKAFHTDSPARIILDFDSVTSSLAMKKNVLHKGEINSFFAIEAAGKMRFVINLKKLLAYEVTVKDNLVFITLRSANVIKTNNALHISDKSLNSFSKTIPQQSINKIDFRRGKKGEGRLLVSLSEPNIVVTTVEKSGKIELTFINTQLPEKYAKKIDVIDFATPVSMLDAKTQGKNSKIWVMPLDGDYTYSAFQADGLFTLEVKKNTNAEDAEEQRRKFPYIGERLSLNFHDIEIRSVIQILADFTNLNIIANDSVEGNITLRLNDVPWDQAFEFILKAKGLGQRQTGNVILVAPISEINKLEEEEIKSRQLVERLEPLRTEYIQINYAKAENFRNILLGSSADGMDGCSVTMSQGDSGPDPTSNRESNKALKVKTGKGEVDDRFSGDTNALISSRGKAIVDSRTNTLIIKDTSTNLDEIRKMLTILDRPVRQVLIEARIVIATEGFAQDLGTKFGAAYQGGDGANTGFDLAGETKIKDGKFTDDLLTNLSASNPYGALGMTLASGADYVLNLEISALQDDNRAEFISNPRILTSDRCKATIEQGEEIPFQTTSQDGTTTEFKDAKITLEVTPQITPSGSVIMELKITKDARGEQTPDGQLAINKREINTSVHIANGDTVVLGGVYEDDKTQIINSVPWFADLPLIGWMFKKELNNHFKKELLIFITPKIIKDSMRMPH